MAGKRLGGWREQHAAAEPRAQPEGHRRHVLAPASLPTVLRRSNIRVLSPIHIFCYRRTGRSGRNSAAGRTRQNNATGASTGAVVTSFPPSSPTFTHCSGLESVLSRASDASGKPSVHIRASLALIRACPVRRGQRPCSSAIASKAHAAEIATAPPAHQRREGQAQSRQSHALLSESLDGILEVGNYFGDRLLERADWRVANKLLGQRDVRE